MLKKISAKIKDMFNKESEFINNGVYTDEIYSNKIYKNEDNNKEEYVDDEASVNYFGSDEYKVDMKRAELRYKFLPNTMEHSSLKDEYINYVEEKLSTLNINNLDTLEIKSWDEWLSNELNFSFDKIKM